MKKLFLIIFVLSTISIMAQTSRHYVSISAGPSFTLNDFKKTNLADTTSGFAKTGLNLKIIYSYKISHNFGVQGNLIFNSNNIDNMALTKEAERLIGNYSFSTESSQAWNSGGIYVTPFFRLPISDKFTWELKGNIGLALAYSPQFLIRGTNLDNTDKTEYFRESAKGAALGLGVGTSFMYKLNKYVLTLNFDYYYSNMHFKEVSGWGWSSDDNPTGTPYNFSIYQTINSAAISLGLAYFL